MGDFFKNRRIVVTGGAGFLGSHLVAKLKERGCSNIGIPRSRDYDLTKAVNVQKMYTDFTPDIVIHLAAVVGGIGANQKNPGKYFYDNLMMGTQLIEFGRRYGLEKFVAIGTVCSYPKFCPAPFKEEAIWDGYPEETNAPYGLAKKMMLVQSKAYREQYGFNSIFLLPANLYGPRDNFDLDTSHVIPALIRKCVTARNNGDPHIVVWGDGSASREFLYVTDAAEGILLATEFYNKSEPVNLGTGCEIRIKDLVERIAAATGFHGDIIWDTSRPNGQPRRFLATGKAETEFGFKAKMPLDEGLKQTIAWYEKTLTY
ncbi:MAG: GDP-L-fucose synthase [Archaeoglobaceae archaeon]|nr:GDP-L-fucose synthase [Archaeoglobaceae archaeon]